MSSPFTGGAGSPESHESGAQPSDMVGAHTANAGRNLMLGTSRAKAAREARRGAQFAKFRLTELNLVPLVDTFVSIVFFALTTAAVGELAPVVKGVSLPESSVGQAAMRGLTLGIGPQVVFAGKPVMSTAAAARAQSNNPAQPLLIPELYTVLRAAADSVRQSENTPSDQSVKASLAVQGDKSMRYDLLSRVLLTARMAGFRNVSLQVHRTGSFDDAQPARQQASR